MEIKDQVCTLPQAVRLSELGITQNSTFHHVYVSEDIDWQIWIAGSFDEYDDEILMHSAFTVAELGQMLPCTLKKDDLHDYSILTFVIDSALQCHTSYPLYHELDADLNEDGSWNAICNNWLKTIGETEAISRADMLIELIEKKIITTDEVNKRLLK